MINRILIFIALLLIVGFLCIRDTYPPLYDAKYDQFFAQPHVEVTFPKTGTYQSDDYGATWRQKNPAPIPTPDYDFETNFTFQTGSDIQRNSDCSTYAPVCWYRFYVVWGIPNSISQWVLSAADQKYDGAIDALPMPGRIFALTPRGILIGEDEYRTAASAINYKTWSLRPFAGQQIEPQPSQHIVPILFLVGMWLPPIPLIHILCLTIVYRYIDEKRSIKTAIIFSIPPIIFCIWRLLTATQIPMTGLVNLARECALCAVVFGVLGVLFMMAQSHYKKTPLIVAGAALMALPVPLISISYLWWGAIFLWASALTYIIFRRGWYPYYSQDGFYLDRWGLDSKVLMFTAASLFSGISITWHVLNLDYPVFYTPYQISRSAIYCGNFLYILVQFAMGIWIYPIDTRKRPNESLIRRFVFTLYLNLIWFVSGGTVMLLLAIQWNWIATTAEIVVRAMFAYYLGV